jgi:hypothetical protein
MPSPPGIGRKQAAGAPRDAVCLRATEKVIELASEVFRLSFPDAHEATSDETPEICGRSNAGVWLTAG